MTAARRLRSFLGLVLVLGLLVGSAAGPREVAAAGTAAALPAWRGGVDLYREGSFTTQRSWLWCTAAGVQIMRNIVERKADHSTSGQRTYFEWMRKRNRYDLPISAGVDPRGWTAGLRHFVDDRYRLVSSRTFDEALRSAVERLRRTNLPVAITVSHGGHGWILTGFQSTADPAATASFKVTSVRVVGPLYGLQSKNGYDMPPNTKLTPTQLKRFFTPWKYDPKPMIWDGRYVSIQPIPVKPVVATPAAAPAAPSPAVSATPVATAEPVGPPSPLVAALASAAPSGPEAFGGGAAANRAPIDLNGAGAATGAGSPIVIAIAAPVGLVAVLGVGVAATLRLRSGRRDGPTGR